MGRQNVSGFIRLLQLYRPKQIRQSSVYLLVHKNSKMKRVHIFIFFLLMTSFFRLTNQLCENNPRLESQGTSASIWDFAGLQP